MTSLWDPIRKIFLKSTPEEKIRQKWISLMIGPLGYPKGLLSVEKEIALLSSNFQGFDPNRRVDIFCRTPFKDELKPLLLVECKAAVDSQARSQILGYNQVIQAPFMCLIQGESVETFWVENHAFRSVAFLPSYRQLHQFLC